MELQELFGLPIFNAISQHCHGTYIIVLTLYTSGAFIFGACNHSSG